ncbi:hypothetical protein WICMUC_002062 [Wickerhamomyces mucosus]|uniref:Signal recognition particle receptor subunit beta n=1 Tax=Wickerhamomyces mucosus TaxID=1378264 RepID=A0A9P8TFG4_9ASCO|nr:hypothetical protein WICMUC_002062 [Wickerhamomyces mucosus]
MVDTHALFITAIAIIFASLLFFIIHHQTNKITIPGLAKQSNKQPTFIITGLSGSGKTTYFNSLIIENGYKISTVTSQEPNLKLNFKAPISGNDSSVPQSNFKLIEFPGHPKLHNLTLDEIRASSNIAGVIFLIDSSSDSKKLIESTKFLYEILLRSERRPNGINILVACNKSDLFSSRQAKTIRQTLETELDNYRKLNVSNISKANEDSFNTEDDEGKELGTSLNDTFKFEKLEGNVDFISGSVLKNKTQDWANWIDERVVNP